VDGLGVANLRFEYCCDGFLVLNFPLKNSILFFVFAKRKQVQNIEGQKSI
jgi:hypothetical protein